QPGFGAVCHESAAAAWTLLRQHIRRPVGVRSSMPVYKAPQSSQSSATHSGQQNTTVTVSLSSPPKWPSQPRAWASESQPHSSHTRTCENSLSRPVIHCFDDRREPSGFDGDRFSWFPLLQWIGAVGSLSSCCGLRVYTCGTVATGSSRIV